MGKSFKLLSGIVLLVFLISLPTFISAEGKTIKYNAVKVNLKNKGINSRGSLVGLKASSFKSYKVIVTVDKLNIRKASDKNSAITGKYDLGNIIDVVGKSGTFVKTDLGYVAEAYTQKIIGKYVSVVNETNLIRNSDLKQDDRIVVPTRYYKIIDSKDNKLLINVGRINGYIPQDSIDSIGDSLDTKLSLGWEYVNKKANNAKIYNDMTEYVNTKSSDLGLDVLCPTWFDVTGNVNDSSSIKVNDIGDKNYVTIAHRNGYQVFGRLCEMDKNRAAIEFSDGAVRTRIINQIAKYAVDYDLDGINVDFEALGSANKDGFTSFMKELYPVLKKLNLNVSVDITKYSTSSSLYSLCYDRPNLAKYSDYLILMGYDEHVSSSKDPGSVGSYNWVDQSIKDIIAQGVPSSKLILAVPFYLRDFAVNSEDSVIFNKSGKVYNLPLLSDSNKLLDGKKGSMYKYLGTSGSWYIIDYNGTKGYVPSSNAQIMPGTITQATSSSAISTTSGNAINMGNGNNNVTGGAININMPYSSIILNKDSVINKSDSIIAMNKVADISANTCLKYIGDQNDWYIVDYNGKNCYVSKSQATFIKAQSRAISGSSISMISAQNNIDQYNGNTYYDELAKQTVGVYFKDGTEHLVWLETDESMEWRMELVSNYDLAGAAVWSLYWKPSTGIWDVIKGNLKDNK